MRKVLTPLFLLISLSIGMFSCSSDDSPHAPVAPENTVLEYEKEILETVSNLSGSIQYNDEAKRWYININVSNTIDSNLEYYPIELDNQYEAKGLRCEFSGEVHATKSVQPRMGGTICYFINLTSIKKI